VILTAPMIGRLALLILVTALAQVTCFSGMVIFGTSPDVAILVVMSLGLLGGSVAGAVSGFTTGLLIDCLLLQTLGAFALAMLAVGYIAGRYRENVGRPTRGAVPLLGGAFTLIGLVAFAAIQVGTGVDADVSTIVIRDAAIKTLIGAALAIPVLLLVRLLVRSALIDDRRSARRPMAPRAAETGAGNP
jgi:rod shape-determining protein MreD